MNNEYLKNIVNETQTYLGILAYDLDNIGFVDLTDDLIIECKICLYRLLQLLDDLGRQQDGN